MATKRELIEPNPGDKRYVRRDAQGRFTDDQVDVSRSLSREARQAAKGERASKTVPKGQGDQGDQRGG
jgi:hypothetical protein